MAAYADDDLDEVMPEDSVSQVSVARSSGRPRPSPHKANSAVAPRPSSSSKADRSGSAKGEIQAECYLCEQPLLVAGRAWRGCDFDVDCFLAVRAYNRLQVGNRSAQKESLNLFLQCTPAWRDRVLPLRKDPSGTRDTNARSNLKAQFETHEKQKGTMNFVDKMKMNLVQFRAFKMSTEQMAAEDADIEFDVLHNEQNGEFDNDVDERVQVYDMPREREFDLDMVRSGSRQGALTDGAVAQALLPRARSRSRRRSPSRARTVSSSGRRSTPQKAVEPDASDDLVRFMQQKVTWQLYRGIPYHNVHCICKLLE